MSRTALLRVEGAAALRRADGELAAGGALRLSEKRGHLVRDRADRAHAEAGDLVVRETSLEEREDFLFGARERFLQQAGTRWIDGVLGAPQQGALQFPFGLALYVVRYDGANGHFDFRAGSIPFPFDWDALKADPSGEAVFRALHYPPRRASTHSELRREMDPVLGRAHQDMMGHLGMPDAVGVIMHPMPDLTMVLFGGLASGPRQLTTDERRSLEQLSFHLENGYRLQLAGDQVGVAEIDASGAVRTTAESAHFHRAIPLHGERVHAARSRHTRQSANALDLWTALVAGHLGLVERNRGSRRGYTVVENAPVTIPMRALTTREIDVLSRAACGDSSKMIAYGLGVSPSLVSTILASCAAKIGVATNTEMAGVIAPSP